MNFPLVSPYGDLTEVKLDYCITIEVKKKIFEKIANPQAFSVE
jgi:predicted Ser/Thr protein kinase